MIGWGRFLGKEARAIAVLAPLLLIATLFSLHSAKLQAASRLADSPTATVSPLPTATPVSGTVVLGLQNNPCVLALIALVVLLAIGSYIWFSRRTPEG